MRTAEPLASLKDIGVELVEGYPKCSQDFNAIESAWKLVRDRLDATLPVGLETRHHFVKRFGSCSGMGQPPPG